MYEGKVIKFYREQANLTQEQLGREICSTTHVSKIERGLTEYSSEITNLLANKLGIDIDKEVSNISTIKEKLDLWHEMIIAQNTSAASEIEIELDNNPLIAVSEYKTLFNMIKLQHNIKLGNFNIIQKQFKHLPKNIEKLPDFEKNLYKHVLGSYNMVMANHLKSIQFLKSIDFESYSNPLVYYDLASAYHHNKSPVLAYYYAEQALNLYKKRNNFLGIIDAENLMIIQIESDYHRDFKETVEQYENLLTICDLCNAMDKKAKILHNYAYEHLRRGNYLEAEKMYKESMELKEKDTAYYLLSLEGFIRCGAEGNLLSQEELLGYIHEGLSIANDINEMLFTIILNLHKYAILNRESQYYRYIDSKALPHMDTHGYIMLEQRYRKELFAY